jgi:hypothetical protein
MGGPPSEDGTAWDTRGNHLPQVRHKAVMCLEDFEFLSIERVGTGDKKTQAQVGGTRR